MSLRARMGLAAGLAVAVAVIAVAVSAYAGTSSELRGQLDQSLQSLSRQVLSNSGPPQGENPNNAGENSDNELDNGSAATASGPGLFGPTPHNGDCDEGLGFQNRGSPFGSAAGILTLVHQDGSICYPSGQSYHIPVTSQFKAIAASGSGQVYTDMHVQGTKLRVLASGIGQRGALLVALPLKDVQHALNRQLMLLVIIAAAGIALAALLGVLVARTALAPIARFTQQTERIAAHPDRLDRERVDVQGGDELARLAQTFNRTLDALEESVQAQRNLVADASHELRTPIATIRANLQLMRDEQLLSPEDRDALRTDIIEELDELTALVGDVVELARGSKLNAAPGEVRVDDIVTAAVDRARRRSPELTIETALEPTLVYGEGDRIARAVANLLDNAAKYGGGAGRVEVALRDGMLTVRDHGPGFNEDDLPFVFDRFHRARDARSKPGSGLGLAIVRQAAEAHGGSVQAANAPGGGAVIRVSFGSRLELDEAELPPMASPS
jgi:two-component system, OmpR family, sensor histidine kinase MprB